MTREYRLQASVGLNVILAIGFGVLLLRKPDRTPTPVAVVTGEQTIAPVAINQPKPPQFKEMKSKADQRRWIVDQLRDAGVSNDVLARFIYADIEESWTKPLEDCHGDPGKLQEKQLQKDMGLDAEMRAALGEAGFKQWDQRNMLREAMLGSKLALNDAEAEAIYTARKKLQQRQWELDRARQNGTIDDVEISQLFDKAYTEFGQQMKTAMGAERYAEAMRPDDGSASLQQSLSKVSASDSQFQEMLKAQQQWNERRIELDKQLQNNPASAAYADQVKALDEARDQEFQRVLGTDAFAAMQKEQDGGYSKMKKYSSAWGLDDGTIDHVYGAVKYYEKSVQDYQAQARALESQGQSVDWKAVNKNLQLFAEQTQQSLQTYLGADRFNKMQQNAVFPFDQQQPHRSPVQ